jgi:hypothetical protein
MSDTEIEPETDEPEIDDPLERRNVGPTVNIKNVTKHVLRFVILDDNFAGALNDRRQPAVVMDPTRRDRDGDPLPLLVGPPNVPAKQHVKQVREMPVEIRPGQSARLPRRHLFALLMIRCEHCSGTSGVGGSLSWAGSCRFQEDPAHIQTWTIVAGRLLGPEQVEVSGLGTRLAIDGACRDDLERSANSGPENNWGRPRRE